MGDLSSRLEAVRSRLAAACARAGRDPSSVRLVAVTKTVSAATVREAIAAGQTLFGENRIQEALPKIAETGSGARWHFVGHLQANKARHAVGAFELIHGVDDASLAAELDRRAAARGIVQAVLAQANLAGEATKHGAGEDGLEALVEAVARAPHLDLRGLMIIPPPAEDPEASRPWFARLRGLRDVLARRVGRTLPELSMGMTDDFEVAIEEGATLVRVGRAIFGERA
ncbi:MAG TPA: YggS family pyridoxal phosphate-dependent enzyme [Candidatus Polarisedimenticolaceae bacterium]|nr:YggS family pyridoxal phosphate-dependent enzyme [Candidatus Polarisedimenticolaceae bacterium]